MTNDLPPSPPIVAVDDLFAELAPLRNRFLHDLELTVEPLFRIVPTAQDLELKAVVASWRANRRLLTTPESILGKFLEALAKRLGAVPETLASLDHATSKRCAVCVVTCLLT